MTMASTLFGCGTSGYTEFKEEEYQYTITIKIEMAPRAQSYLHLFSNEEPLLTQDGNRTPLRAKGVVCPTSLSGKNSFPKNVLSDIGCQSGIYDYSISTDKTIVYTSR